MSAAKRTTEDRAREGKLLAKIRKWDDPILSQVCEDVTPNDSLDFLPLMARVCAASKTGVGLAAPQIGISKRVIYIAPQGVVPYFMINPVIESVEGNLIDSNEGCLSFPGIFCNIKRSPRILVSYNCPDYNFADRVKKWFDGFEAIIVQHESDHINGISPIRDFWRSTLRNLH